MRRIFGLLCLVVILALAATAARASDYTDMDICLGRQIVARILCKDPREVDYVAQVRDNVYLFSVFYANRKARFFVGVYKDMIRVQGKDFQTATRSIPYHFDAVSKCGVVDYTVRDCITQERIVCCSEKTIEEKMDDRFWDRPIPDLLEEDLRRALEANATQPGGPTPPEGRQP
ncbi:MAG: hypothetical protein V3571_06910 [Pseudodesulfovibrio sp.]